MLSFQKTVFDWATGKSVSASMEFLGPYIGKVVPRLISRGKAKDPVDIALSRTNKTREKTDDLLIERFANDVNALEHGYWSEAFGIKPLNSGNGQADFMDLFYKSVEKTLENGGHIHFNLTGMLKPGLIEKAIKGVTKPLDAPETWATWELSVILRNKKMFENTTFYIENNTGDFIHLHNVLLKHHGIKYIE